MAFYGLSYKIYSNLIQPAYYFVNSIFPILSGKHDKKRELFKISFLLILAGLIILIPLVYIFAPFSIGPSNFVILNLFQDPYASTCSLNKEPSS